MTISISRGGRADAARMVSALQDWAQPSCYAAGFHAGDLGWHLRLDDELIERSILCVEDGTELVATGIAEDSSLRAAFKPDRLYDLQVAGALVELVCAGPRTTEAYVEAAPASAFRSLLSERGWIADPDLWVVWYRGLTARSGV